MANNHGWKQMKSDGDEISVYPLLATRMIGKDIPLLLMHTATLE
jgi:hypothetical protein